MATLAGADQGGGTGAVGDGLSLATGALDTAIANMRQTPTAFALLALADAAKTYQTAWIYAHEAAS